MCRLKIIPKVLCSGTFLTILYKVPLFVIIRLPEDFATILLYGSLNAPEFDQPSSKKKAEVCLTRPRAS